jgi:hypothetical protein
MFNRLIFPLFAVFIFSLFSTAKGADPVKDEPTVFTNEDIEKYHASSGAGTEEPKLFGREDRDTDRKYEERHISEEREMEYWCKKAKTINRRIEDDRTTVKEIKDQGDEPGTRSSSSRKKTATLEKKLEKAKKRLRNSEGDLKDLEDEAHRKGVPPGWLRCQT